MSARIVAKFADGLTIVSTIAMLLAIIIYAITVPPSRGLAGLANGLIIGILLVGIAVQIFLSVVLYVYKYTIAKIANHSRRGKQITCFILHILVMILPGTLCAASFEMYSGSTSWKRFVTLMIIICISCLLGNLIATIALPFTKDATNEKEA